MRRIIKVGRLSDLSAENPLKVERKRFIFTEIRAPRSANWLSVPRMVFRKIVPGKGFREKGKRGRKEKVWRDFSNWNGMASANDVIRRLEKFLRCRKGSVVNINESEGRGGMNYTLLRNISIPLERLKVWG